MSQDARFPIGKFAWPDSVPASERERCIAAIAAAPAQLREAVRGLSPAQLDTPYREGGWTVRQVVHHVPDSHINSYVRFKLALTENNPVVKSYDEAAWAELPDGVATPVETSLALLENLHVRWTALFERMSEPDWKRTFQHPDLGSVALEKNLALYAWHGAHHTAHVTELRRRNAW